MAPGMGNSAGGARHAHPLWAVLKGAGVQWLLVVLGLLICGGAYLLQHAAFPRQGTTSGQILATVYVKNRAARLQLESFVWPNDPARDHVLFSVTGPQGSPDPWLLVVQCPVVHGFSPRHQVNFFLENAQSGQVPRRVIAVAQPPGVQKKSWKVYLGCFAPPSAQPKHKSAGVTTDLRAGGGLACTSFWLRFGCFTALPAAAKSTSGVATGQTINLSLPTLEGDPAAQLTQVATPLYAEEGADAAIKDLVEVYQAPGVVCSAPVPSTIPSPVDTSSASGSSAPSAAPASASPSPSGHSRKRPHPQNATCYTPKAPNSEAVAYHLPKSVETTETLENEDLSGDRVDSMFPTGQIKSNSQIFWQGNNALSPSLSATNLAAESRNSEYSFFAGVAYGLGLSIIFAFLQVLLNSWNDAKASGNPPAAKAATDEPWRY
jgi:hypothetical protein